LSTVIIPKKRKKTQDKVFGYPGAYGPTDDVQDSSKKGPTEHQKAKKRNSGGLAKDDEAVSKLKVGVSPLHFNIYVKCFCLGNSGCLWRTKGLEERICRFGHTVRTS